MYLNPDCVLTHAQAFAGNCPWCDADLNSLRSVPRLVVARSRKCHWDVDAIESALGSLDAEVRMATLANLVSDDGPELEAVFPLLERAMRDRSAYIRMLAVRAIASLGRRLSADHADTLTKQMQGPPSGLATKALLLAHYLLDDHGAGRGETTATEWAVNATQGHPPTPHR